MVNNTAQGYERKIAWIKRILLLIVLFFVIGVVMTFFKVSTEAHQVLREAKNVRVCMRLLAIESYGLGNSIYDPTRKNGLAEGVAEEIAELSKEEGEVTLTAWNEEENLPKQFSYQKGNYIAYYDSEGDKYKTWDIYIQIKLLNFENSEE